MTPPVNSNPAADNPATIGTLLRGNALPPLEASVLLAHALNVRRESVLAYPERSVATAVEDLFRTLVERRLAGFPIAYLTGSREFHGIELGVSPAVLIPRPETELLVDAALARIGAGDAGPVLDLGTGSGAIAIAIAVNRPQVAVEAVDASAAAIAVATANVSALSLRNIDIHLSDWYQGCAHRRYALIVSNPPYVRDGDPHLEQGDVRHEPRLALVAGPDGLDAIRTIVAGAGPRLGAGGGLMFEHGYDQAEACCALMVEAGFANVMSLRDLAGIERVCVGTKPAERLQDDASL